MKALSKANRRKHNQFIQNRKELNSQIAQKEKEPTVLRKEKDKSETLKVLSVKLSMLEKDFFGSLCMSDGAKQHRKRLKID